jgi:uncharacterized membrane protein
MADYEARNDLVAAGDPPVTAALVCYALYGVAGVVSLASAGMSIAPLFGLVGLIGLIIAYVKRGEAQGTWVASHFRWLIRTFWFALLWAIVGWLLVLTLIGILISILIWAVTSLWILYRVVRGYLYFKDNKPVPGM